MSEEQTPNQPPVQSTGGEDENKLVAQRREKLSAIREAGPAFPNDFRPDSMAGELLEEHQHRSKEFFETQTRAGEIKLCERTGRQWQVAVVFAESGIG